MKVPDRSVTSPASGSQIPGASNAPASMTTITGNLSRPAVKLAAIDRAEMLRMSRPVASFSALPPGIIAVQGAFDLSGSTGQNHSIINDAELGLVAKLGEKPDLAERIRYCSTKMSDSVLTTGYVSLREFSPLAITAFGGSPHNSFNTQVIRNCVQMEAECMRTGVPLLASVVLYQADGWSSDGPPSMTITPLRELQSRRNVHLFPIRIPPVDEDFIRAVSVGHQPADFVGDAIKTLFDNLLALITAVAQDPSALGRTKSMKTADIPRPRGADSDDTTPAA